MIHTKAFHFALSLLLLEQSSSFQSPITPRTRQFESKMASDDNNLILVVGSANQDLTSNTAVLPVIGETVMVRCLMPFLIWFEGIFLLLSSGKRICYCLWGERCKSSSRSCVMPICAGRNGLQSRRWHFREKLVEKLSESRRSIRPRKYRTSWISVGCCIHRRWWKVWRQHGMSFGTTNQSSIAFFSVAH